MSFNLRSAATPIALALVSLLLAVALWVAVTDAENPRESYDYGGGLIITPINVPQGLAVARMSDTIVFVRVRASEDTFSELTVDDFRAEVNLSGERQDTSNKAVSVRVVGREDVEIVEVTPSTIEVLLDSEASRVVPVQINRLGAAPQGILVSSIEANPTTVTITGAASLVAVVESAAADVSLTGLRVNQQQQIVLAARDDSNRGLSPLRIEPSTVDVRLTVEQTAASRSVPITFQTSGQVAEGYQLSAFSLSQSSVTIEGPVQVVQALRSIDTEDFDLTGINASQTRAIELQLPTGVTTQRNSINVTLTVEAQIADWAVAVAPFAENVPEGLQATFQTAAVSLVIRGELPTLNRLAPGAIRAVVDVAELEEGAHLVEPEIRLPAEITLVSIEPEEVVVVLEP